MKTYVFTVSYYDTLTCIDTKVNKIITEQNIKAAINALMKQMPKEAKSVIIESIYCE